jgi:phosphoglycolate phosphatase-like HAD superfamily hydrolase
MLQVVCFLPFAKGCTLRVKVDLSDSALRRLIGLPLKKQFQELTGSQDENRFRIFKNHYVEVRDSISGSPKDQTHPFPGIIPALQELKGRGIRLGVVSSGATDRIRETMNRHNALLYFDAVVGGKLDKAQGIDSAVNQLRATNQESLYLGDRSDDEIVAIKARVSFIGVMTGAFRKSDFPPECILLPSVAQLPAYLKSA